jgi:hypothetical protein
MDFMPNRTLDEVNEQVYRGAPPAAWGPTAKSKAVIGIAAGMCFLHSLGFFHRLLTPKHVLLDENWQAQIAGSTTVPGWPNVPAFRFEVLDDDYAGGSDVYSFAFCLHALFLAVPAGDRNIYCMQAVSPSSPPPDTAILLDTDHGLLGGSHWRAAVVRRDSRSRAGGSRVDSRGQ